jgi:diguanylate cyclase (GGDEF)-like protein
MEESLELELSRAVRSQTALSVLLITLDGFQHIEEECGLDASDFTLHRTGELLQSNVRKGDIVCRFSGHTFVIILPQCTHEVGRQRAESMRKLLKTLEIKNNAGMITHISASLGLATFPDHGQTIESLMSAVEAAASRARSNGGDCVVTVAF